MDLRRTGGNHRQLSDAVNVVDCMALALHRAGAGLGCELSRKPFSCGEPSPLRGPGIRPTTAICDSYTPRSGFVCKLNLPLGIKTGRQHRYTLMAYENNGFGFVIAPGEPTAKNPVTIRFG